MQHRDTRRLMMAQALLPLILTAILTKTSALMPSTGTELVSSCPPGWHLLGQRCFAFYPVWSSWSGANSLCSRTPGFLASLHTLEDMDFLRQLTNSSVWLGGYRAQQNGSWLWRDQSSLSSTDWTDHMPGNAKDLSGCMQMEPKSGELQSAPCSELRFYICSTSCGSMVPPSSSKSAKPGVAPGVSLFDVMWSNSDLLAEEILFSSPFLQELASGRLTQRCYARFVQQEAFYLHRVSSTLQALTGRLQETDDMRSLLLDTLQHYRNRNQSLVTFPPPEWLHFSLQAFHDVVLEEPVYWVVALSARASLRNFLAVKLLPSEIRPETQPRSWSEAKALYQMWDRDSLREAAWTHRYKTVIEQHQDQMVVFKAINVFRTHMMSQKSLYKSVICGGEDEEPRSITNL